jgi:hypothetical protein
MWKCGKEYETRHSGISKFCHQNCKQRNRTKKLKLIHRVFILSKII